MQPDKAALPSESSSPLTRLEADVCVIGGGPGGLAVATGAAAFGRRVVLIEKSKMGGNSLGCGSVPSNAFLAAAHRAHQIRSCGPFGIAASEPEIDLAAVNRHVRSVVADISRNDSAERFKALGVQVIHAPARFTGPSTIAAGDFVIEARRIVIATGSVPVIPPIAGLDGVRYLTNETIFENSVLPQHLIIAGGGPFGIEMAQAHRRLGARVTVLEARKVLARYDPEMSGRLLALLRQEGVEIRENTSLTSVQSMEGGLRAELSGPKGMDNIEGSALLIAAGQQPNVSGLNLSAAGIRFDKSGISVDAGLRTSNRKVYAIGDVAGGPAFTHVAEYHAGIVLRRILFRLPAKASADAIPWVAFTQPELAHVGLSEADAAARKIKPRILRWSFAQNDRAITDRVTEGHVKVVTDHRGRVLGATILGAEAGELIQVWSLAIARGMEVKDIANSIPAYPTLGEVNRRAALRFFTDSPANPLLRRVIGWLAKAG
ncbi:MAG: FAD-dependent oxidoreductase [Hyphomicrobium sp.]|jgi:pyruvate/2-oxoglutarate dehydrogenase complex dihydrolipoamide dehydrogenase (E3) component|nr:FAD-dependent oxidoreductase [Hyphomicrobium sp.]